MWLTFYKTINSILLGTVLYFNATLVFASIGSVVEQQGPNAELKRNKQILVAAKGTELEQNDEISTAKTKLNLKFDDDTMVAMTEQSVLVIDDFVYDPGAKTGKLAMNVAMGTVRYASGGIAKNNRENVRMRTPTATISVRGTDFTMTVDEIGQSMVVLLPSCPWNNPPKNQDECPVGEIMVSTDAGYVLMNQSYQATVVASAYQEPTAPKILDKNTVINNLLIIAPPPQFPNGLSTVPSKSESTFLDGDLLAVDLLMMDLLSDDNLDEDHFVDQLDEDLFPDPMQADDTELQTINQILPNIRKFQWISGDVNEQEISVSANTEPHIAEIQVNRDTSGMAYIRQNDRYADLIIQNGGDNVIININQQGN